MDEKPDQIMNHIESQRNELGRNLNELETRVRRTTDWRVQFDRNPMLMMGVALGGGLLLGTITGSSRKSGRSSWSSSAKSYGTSNVSSSSGYSSPSSYGSSSPGYGLAGAGAGAGYAAGKASSSPALREQRRKATDTLEQMKAALIGFATAKVKEFMTEALPGFNQHLDEAERRHQEFHEAGGEQQRQQSPGYGQGTSDQQRSEHGSGQSGQYGGGQQPGGSYGTGSTGTQTTGSTRTEQSTNTPYRQDPVKTGLNT
jgi:hypothetical protein